MFGRRPTSTLLDSPAQESLPDTSPPEGVVQLFTPKTERVRKSVEQLLLDRGHITEEQLLQAKQVQAQTPGKQIAQILLTMNAASEAQILEAQAEFLGLAFEQPDRSEIDMHAFGMLQPDYIRKHFVLPIRLDAKA